MDHSISLDDLVDQLSNFMLVHGPNLIESVFIRLLKSLELVLELLKLLSDLLILLSKFNILLLEVLGLGIELVLYCS